MQNWKVRKRFLDDEPEDEEEDLPIIFIRADKLMKPPSQDKKCHRFKDKLKIEAINTARRWIERDLKQPKYIKHWYH